MTPLHDIIAARIEANGPITVAAYMSLCLVDPEHGYYMNRDPFGRAGDFITAPEISQMFGELLGLWVVAGWQAAGSPSPFNLMEFGPGRGTMMADMLRAASGFPAFAKAAQVHLVETSPVLRQAQEAALATSGLTPIWHQTVPGALKATKGALFILGNEFLDALPIHQFVLTEEGWRERLVGLDDEGEFIFSLAGATPPDVIEQILQVRTNEVGVMAEVCPTVVGTVRECASALAARGGLALFIDYGHGKSAPGETLQAVKDHEHISPLSFAGEADLTAHVDFEAVARAALAGGSHAFGPLDQSQFLTRIGIGPRAERLVSANPVQEENIKEALDRLTSESRMGKLFKVMALAPAGATPPGFEPDEIFRL